MKNPEPGYKRFTLVFLILSSAYLVSLGLRPYTGSWAVKAAPILLAALVAVLNLKGRERIFITAGFIFSASGDILLNLENMFLPGLASFLIAHLLYISAFLSRFVHRRSGYFRVAVPLVAVILLYLYMIPLEEHLMIPVSAYIIVITVMMITAAFRGGSVLVYYGAVFFMISDAIIAVNKFVQPVENASYLIMISYYLAQYLILTGLIYRPVFRAVKS